MAIARAQVIIRTVDNIPENFITNTLYFDTESFEDLPDDVAPAITDFFDAFVSWYSPAVAETGHSVKWYIEDQPSPNFPYAETSWDFSAAPSGTALPSEVALCASYEAVKINGVNQATRRGRLYIGPLNTLGVSSGRPGPNVLRDWVAAMWQFEVDVAQTGTTPGDHIWVVYSAKLGTGSTIVEGWCDNAYDTQRRRGVSPTSRRTWDRNLPKPT